MGSDRTLSPSRRFFGAARAPVIGLGASLGKQRFHFTVDCRALRCAAFNASNERRIDCFTARHPGPQASISTPGFRSACGSSVRFAALSASATPLRRTTITSSARLKPSPSAPASIDQEQGAPSAARRYVPAANAARSELPSIDDVADEVNDFGILMTQ
jgi:hypothetical protein